LKKKTFDTSGFSRIRAIGMEDHVGNDTSRAAEFSIVDKVVALIPSQLNARVLLRSLTGGADELWH
jgi:hypothetical protein